MTHIFTLVLLPIYLLKAIFRKKYRRAIRDRLGFLPAEFYEAVAGKKVVWIHAASIGEVNIAKTLINELREENLDLKFVLSTSTHSGRQMAKNKLDEEVEVILLPMDLFWIIGPVLVKVKPELSIIVEPDLWPNFVYFAKKHGGKVMMVNTWIGRKSIGQYLWLPGLLPAMLKRLDKCTVQTETDLEKIEKYCSNEFNDDKYKITGNIKFDQLEIDSQESEYNQLLDQYHLKSEMPLFIAGSTHPGEEEIILKSYQELKEEFDDLILLIAPRHIERAADIVNLCQDYGFVTVKKTELVNKGSREAEVIILDTIGELTKVYALGSIVFIGGTLIDQGGHNLLEPAAQGNPVLFGPHNYNCQESAELLKQEEVGFKVKSQTELVAKTKSLLADKGQLTMVREKAKKLIIANQGSIKKNLNLISEFLIEGGE
ncbi:MAG: 3-deoxy-D-manno-octulosonic-acid transferase [Candidatus Frackibacter sp. T328-2]|nr:MAG: 3-deoxy-D-manno-octulosonic-acid transferase [Candidatus Frackibacter sp. T328-2]